MYNKSQFSKDQKAAKQPKKLARPIDIDYVSQQGYSDGSPFNTRPYIDINTPNGVIDMTNTGRDLIANGRFLPKYSGRHQFDTDVVREIPLAEDGMTYWTYKGRPDAKYKKDSKGNWLISTPDTKGKFIPIDDPTGSRTKELNKNARRTSAALDAFTRDVNLEGPDTFLENALEFIDPTGYLSHDDAREGYREWQESNNTLPTLGQSLEMFGAVPALGKLGKLKYLANSPEYLKPVYKYFPWQQTLNTIDFFDDTKEQLERDFIIPKDKKENWGGAGSSWKDGGEYMDLTDEEIRAYRDGGYIVEELPKAQNGDIVENNKLKEKIFKRYPGYINTFGDPNNFHIVEDPNFRARDYGYGDIEYIGPDTKEINYTSDYTYNSPFPGEYVIPYNPNSKINKGDIFLDMSHGLASDPNVAPYLEFFDQAALQARGDDMMWDWEEEKQNPDYIKALESEGSAAFEQFKRNYLDGLLRSELSRKGMGRKTTDKGYKTERRGNSKEMREAANYIYDYLKGRDLPTNQDGGIPKMQNAGTTINLTSDLNPSWMQMPSLETQTQTQTFQSNQPYTYSGRPGSYYKMIDGKMNIKNRETDWKYIEMKDPTGERLKTLEAGLKSGSTKPYVKPVEPKLTTTINDFYFSKDELTKQELQNDAYQCLLDAGSNCQGSSFLYYDKYIAPKLGLDNSWTLKEKAGISSGEKGNPNYNLYGESADSWELRAAFGNNVKEFYSSGKGNEYELYNKLKNMTEPEKDQYFRDLNLPIGTIIQGGIEGYDVGKKPGSSYNEQKGYAASHHTGIVVGYDKYGTPIIYDYGNVRKITDPRNLLMSEAYAINNIYVPKQNAQYTYDYLKKNNKFNEQIEDLNMFIPGQNIITDKDEMGPFVENLKKHKTDFMNVFNLSNDEYDELAKISAATALTETKGGRDFGTLRVGIPTYALDKLAPYVNTAVYAATTGLYNPNVGQSKGITQINPKSVWAKNDKGEYRDSKLVTRLGELGINEYNYDAWNPYHQAAITMGLMNSNVSVVKNQIKKNPLVKQDLSLPEGLYYQWFHPGALTTDDPIEAARGDNENVKRFMENYNLINIKRNGGKIPKMQNAGTTLEEQIALAKKQKQERMDAFSNYFSGLDPYSDTKGNIIDLNKMESVPNMGSKIRYDQDKGTFTTPEGVTLNPDQYEKIDIGGGLYVAKIKSNFGKDRFKYYALDDDYNKEFYQHYNAKGREYYPIYSTIPYRKYTDSDAEDVLDEEQFGGNISYNIGDEIDEFTKNYLEGQGYTFEKI